MYFKCWTLPALTLFGPGPSGVGRGSHSRCAFLKCLKGIFLNWYHERSDLSGIKLPSRGMWDSTCIEGDVRLDAWS